MSFVECSLIYHISVGNYLDINKTSLSLNLAAYPTAHLAVHLTAHLAVAWQWPGSGRAANLAVAWQLTWQR